MSCDCDVRGQCAIPARIRGTVFRRGWHRRNAGQSLAPHSSAPECARATWRRPRVEARTNALAGGLMDATSRTTTRAIGDAGRPAALTVAPALMVLFCGGAVACSNAAPPPSWTTGGPPASSPVVAPSPASSAASAAVPAGHEGHTHPHVADAAAGHEDHDHGHEGATPGPSVTTPPFGGACVARTGTPTCDQCLEQNCCAQVSACEADADCPATDLCLASCGQPGANPQLVQQCEARCFAQHPTGAPKLDAIFQCAGQRCPSQCQ